MPSDHPRSKWIATTFVVVGLAMSAVGLAYFIYAGQPRKLFPDSVPDDYARLQQSKALFRMLLHSFLIFLAFLFGSYLMVRIGRVLARVKKSENKTEYVDAWSGYRLTQEELDTATSQLEEDFPPDLPPANPEPDPE